MFNLPPELDRFFTVWKALPRTAHSLLPCKNEITPAALGDLLHSTGIAKMVAPFNLQVTYAGSGYEKSASTHVTGSNYYDLLPPAFHKPMALFHNNLLGTPCGAFVADVITTTSGSQYLHETIQLPMADPQGDPIYLVAYAHGRKPYGDTGERKPGNHNASSVRDMFYLDLGAGAPGDYIKNFRLCAPAGRQPV
ncbi:MULTISPECIES: PAS domain-containing protein [Kordiimonas]|jgi:hypothetical protein|uniref:PAS domain-containing protein n=1 Tax=Kordiimonas TaxID=288021 RepID=UPI00257E366E|nr:PAS domain-containing protein [Kordiimonas sp. UBA4487]